jgi:two-component system, chemotaxis family, protein-glutamate methylesterase/glutaminase
MPMCHRDILVIGASAGGVEALQAVAAGLPADFPAAVAVVLHMPAGGTSVLPAILARAGPLPAVAAADGMPLRPGRIFVAPPGHHLMVGDGRLHLSHGPTENGHRPAVDVLFRSAAHALGPRVIGAVLSGALDDGAAGMVAIAARGGLTVVQDPAEALYRSMPDSVLQLVEVDHILPAGKMGTVLAELARETVDVGAAAPASALLGREVDMAGSGDREQRGRHPAGEPAGMSCPDCGGSLTELDNPGLRYRCHVGHAWSPAALLAEQSATAERAMWLALRTLEEKADLARRMLLEWPGRPGVRPPRLAERYRATILECEHAVAVIREMLLAGVPPTRPPGDDRQ